MSKNLLDNLRLTRSSSTRSTRGGTAQSGARLEWRTRSSCLVDESASLAAELGAEGDRLGVAPEDGAIEVDAHLTYHAAEVLLQPARRSELEL